MRTALSGSNSVVESQPSKLLVAGSIPVSRSIFSTTCKTIDFTPLLTLLTFLVWLFRIAVCEDIQSGEIVLL